MNNISLIGYMGVGKSTVANCIGYLSEMTVIDIDNCIKEKENMSINQIFQMKGENYFRDIETYILETLQNKTNNTVISCGGGIILRDENITYLKKLGKIVLLECSAKTIYERIKNCDNRPILNKNMSISYIENMLESRFERYTQFADLIINVENKSVNDIAKEIILQK